MIEIEMPASVFAGDPVPLTVVVRNPSEAARGIVYPAFNRGSAMAIEIKSPNSTEFVRLKSGAPRSILDDALVHTGPISTPALLVELGEEARLNFFLDFEFSAESGNPVWLFPSPGRYEIRCSFEEIDQDVVIENNQASSRPMTRTITTTGYVEIAAPNDPDDALILKELHALKTSWLAYRPAHCGFDVPTELVEFLRRHPNSRFAPFVEMLVARGEFLDRRATNIEQRSIDGFAKVIALSNDERVVNASPAWQAQMDLLFATMCVEMSKRSAVMHHRDAEWPSSMQLSDEENRQIQTAVDELVVMVRSDCGKGLLERTGTNIAYRGHAVQVRLLPIWSIWRSALVKIAGNELYIPLEAEMVSSNGFTGYAEVKEHFQLAFSHLHKIEVATLTLQFCRVRERWILFGIAN